MNSLVGRQRPHRNGRKSNIVGNVVVCVSDSLDRVRSYHRWRHNLDGSYIGKADLRYANTRSADITADC
jgi:hypothetical protein